MLVPDLMHEFELGVWKSVFIHLMRILHAHGSDAVSELNFRLVLSIVDADSIIVTLVIEMSHLSVRLQFANFTTMHQQ